MERCLMASGYKINNKLLNNTFLTYNNSKKMKHLLYIILTFCSVATMANNIDDIKSAIKAGDSAKLASYFDRQVEICTLDEEDVVNPTDGKTRLELFFKAHKPKSITQFHKGKSKSKTSQYLTGTMVDTNGNSFRVYIYLKQVGDKQLIQELRFDK